MSPTSPGIVVDGFVEPGFEPVGDAFRANFDRHGEVGAAVSVYLRGRAVVDLWAGVADLADGKPWNSDTIAMCFSTTKGITATCMNLLVERGLLDLDVPVARYWPEFAAKGKESIPVRWLVSHQAGVAAVEGDVTMDDVIGWDGVVAAIAAQAPNWPPGTAHGYHARSYGWANGEVLRRITGQTVGQFWRTEIAEPLGLDFWIGLPESAERRCAALIPDPDAVDLGSILGEDHLMTRVMQGPNNLFAGGYDESWNSRQLRSIEMPSSNGIGDARSIGRLYGSLVAEVDGRRTLRADTIAAATVTQASGRDAVLGFPRHNGIGYSVQPSVSEHAGPAAFGHAGAGGSVGFADPAEGIGFGYVMNQLRFSADGDPRAPSLVKSLYTCLG